MNKYGKQILNGDLYFAVELRPEKRAAIGKASPSREWGTGISAGFQLPYGARRRAEGSQIDDEKISKSDEIA